MNELKIKLIKEKPKKVYAATIEYDYHIQDLIQFLENTKEKKLSIVINGKLFNLPSSVAKNKFLDGFKLAHNILINHILEAKEYFDTNIKSIKAENLLLKKEAEAVKKAKELYQAKEAAMSVRVDAWKDRITELEDTCQVLRSLINETNKNAK